MKKFTLKIDFLDFLLNNKTFIHHSTRFDALIKNMKREMKVILFLSQFRSKNRLKTAKFKKSIKTLSWRDSIFHFPIDVFWYADSKYHKINRYFSVNKRILVQKRKNAKNRFLNLRYILSQYDSPLFTYC